MSMMGRARADAFIARLNWALLVLIALVVVGTVIVGQPRTVTLAIGRVSANDTEREACQFAIGNDASLVLHPQGIPCVLAKELIGSTGTLIFVRD